MYALGRAKKKEKTYHFMTMDIETGEDNTYHSALLGEPVYISWCVDGIGRGVPSDDLTLWLLNEFLLYQYSGYILYAHNAFGFDYKRIKWDLLADYGYTCEFLTGNDGSIKSVTIRGDECEWILRDSLLLIPRKLEEVTKKFAPDYMKLKRVPGFDVKPFDPLDKGDCEYAIQDSVGLWFAIARVDRLLQEHFDVSIHDAATLPGIAFRAFRSMFTPRIKGRTKSEDIPAEKYPGIGWGLAHAARES